MDVDTLKGLSSCPLFGGLTELEIMDLMHAVRYRVVSYRKGEIFTYAGSPCLHADIVLDGEMKANLIGPTGRIIRMTMHHSGNMLAPAFLFAKDNLYPVTVEAATDARVLRLSPGDLEQLLHADTRLMMNFVRILSNIIAYLTKKVGSLSLNVREKVCLYLKEQQRQQQTDSILLPMSRQELADLFAIQKYSLLRCLSELQQTGAIKVEGRQIQIVNL